MGAVIFAGPAAPISCLQKGNCSGTARRQALSASRMSPSMTYDVACKSSSAIFQLTRWPDFIMSKSVGVLLIHGLTGMPSEMRPVEKYFVSRGFEVEVPLLAGH